MYTSIVLVALAGSTLTVAAPESPEFRTNYWEARKVGKTDRKPLAVFLGSGPKGWEQRTTDGQLSQGAQDLLKSHYVCVYLDTSSEEGQRLARDFEMKEGIVLSDGSGDNQAFRHEGKLSNSDLERQLKKFSDPTRVAARTETNDRQSFYPPDDNRTSGYYAPNTSYYYPPTYSSIPFGGGGSCPSCGGGFRR